MSCCQQSGARTRPGTARVTVTEMSGSGLLNPTPAGYEGCAVDRHLSPPMLKSLCGNQDLSRVTSLEICVNTRENTLANLGAYLPKLVELKMNNSTIMSVRDLGTSLSHLQVLWMSRCGLEDLDGIPAFSSLKELYLAYNRVSDLSQVSMLEELQVLDLEGNNVEDLVHVQYLGLCLQLRTLSLEGNPVCVRPHPIASQDVEYSYRVAVRELVPQLRYLDDVRAEGAEPSASSSSSPPVGEEWAAIRDAIRDCNSTEAAALDDLLLTSAEDRPRSRPGSAKRPGFPSVRPLSSLGSRPLSGSGRGLGSRPVSATTGTRAQTSPGSRPGSAGSDPAEVDPDASSLTHGAGKILFCGNPVQALRARRERLKTAPVSGAPARLHLPIHVPEHTYDLEEPSLGERSDVFAELRSWRERHSKRLQFIERERLPEVLTIEHGDEEDDDDDEGLGVAKSEEGDDSDESDDERAGEEEQSGDVHDDVRATASPESSSQCLSPDSPQRETLSSPDQTRLSLGLFSPSPPSGAAPSPLRRGGGDEAAPARPRPPGVRTRRLTLRPATGGASSVARSLGGNPAAESELSPQGVQEGPRPRVPLRPLTATVPYTSSGHLAQRHRDPCGETDLSTVHPVNQHPTSRPLDRPAIMRPHTANAALQKHLQRYTLQSSRGSSHLD